MTLPDKKIFSLCFLLIAHLLVVLVTAHVNSVAVTNFWLNRIKEIEEYMEQWRQGTYQ